MIGSNSPTAANFCAYALDQGYQVIATSRSPEKEGVFLPYTWGKRSNVLFQQIDLNQDMYRLRSLMKHYRPAYVVNFSSQGMVAQSWDNPTHWMQTNVVAMAALLEVLRSADWLERYIHFSTPEVYGSTPKWTAESRIYAPSTPYALSRAAGDMSVALWAKTYGLPAVITRAANVYGEGQQLYRIIPRAFMCCLTGQTLPLQGDGLSERSFVHFDDVSRGVLLVCEQGRSGDDYHLSPRSTITIRDLVGKICAMSNKSFDAVVTMVSDRLGKDQSYLLDSGKIEKELGWRPLVELDDGLHRCAAWCRENLDVLRRLSQFYEHKP